MYGAKAGAYFFCLEPEPTQVGQSRSWSRSIKWQLRNTGCNLIQVGISHNLDCASKYKLYWPQSGLYDQIEVVIHHNLDDITKKS